MANYARVGFFTDSNWIIRLGINARIKVCRPKMLSFKQPGLFPRKFATEYPFVCEGDRSEFYRCTRFLADNFAQDTSGTN